MPEKSGPQPPFSPIEEILEDLRAGKFIVLCDDEDRENEGDLVCAAELIDADKVNFMLTEGRGTSTIHEGTSQIIITDVRSVIDRAQALINELDRPTPQARSLPSGLNATARGSASRLRRIVT